MDARSFAAEIKAGNLDGAMKVLSKSIPFPGIIGRVCDHPCQAACKRREAGDAIAIAALERVCVSHSATPARTPVQIKKDKRVAVVGGGLSGLTVAYDLSSKGYPVVLFEAKDRLGGSLWEFTEEVLPRTVIEEETAVLKDLGVEIRLGAAAGITVSLSDLRREFDAVYLGLENSPGDTWGWNWTRREGSV
jgi:NADPH-dependent glutamate synthase beta subunit-like oxidoreductase